MASEYFRGYEVGRADGYASGFAQKVQEKWEAGYKQGFEEGVAFASISQNPEITLTTATASKVIDSASINYKPGE